MPTFGSDGGFQADNRGGVIDDQGNTIVSSDTEFASSPLGVAARTQALYGIPNANFNLVPPTPSSPIVANQNDLPYWSIEDLSGGLITATTVFDSTTQTWGVELNPGTAVNGSSLSLSTRSYLITDDNLALRQKALAVLSKSGTAAVSTQWNLTLSAIYYNANDTALSTAFIGTALDTGTWTSFSGTTTPGGSAISAAAQYVDLTFTLTTTADVTGSAKATIKSLLLSTSSAANGSFVVAETFNSSGTWTRPTGVDYLLAVIAIGAGGGGQSGDVWSSTASSSTTVAGGLAGATSCWFIARDLYVGDVSSVSVGIGAGGVGGAGTTFTKAAAGTGTILGGAKVNGGTGGATTFGTYVSINGAGQAGTAVTTVTSSLYDQNLLGGRGAPTSASTGTATATAGNAGSATTYSALPYTPPGAAGNAGGAGTATQTRNGTAYPDIASAAGGAAGTAGYQGTGANGGGAVATNTPGAGIGGAGGTGGGGGGGGGASLTGTGAGVTGITSTGTAGNGGNGAANCGAGGGGGGAVGFYATSSSTYNATDVTIKAGNGGNGSDGKVIVLYVS